MAHQYLKFSLSRLMSRDVVARLLKTSSSQDLRYAGDFVRGTATPVTISARDAKQVPRSVEISESVPTYSCISYTETHHTFE